MKVNGKGYPIYIYIIYYGKNMFGTTNQIMLADHQLIHWYRSSWYSSIDQLIHWYRSSWYSSIDRTNDTCIMQLDTFDRTPEVHFCGDTFEGPL